jgi:lipopolysaccharide biosynthesis regulator YciM
LLSRADLSQAERDRAQHALALDYLKAGLLDRAEDALSKLEGTAHEAQALLALLSIYERSRDWPKASVIAQKLSQSGQGSFQGRLAHYLCEQAQALDVSTQSPQVIALLEQAIAAAPQSTRAHLALADVFAKTGLTDQAFDKLMQVARDLPSAVPLMAAKLAQHAQALNRVDETLHLLETYYARTPSLDVLQAIVALHAARGDAHPNDWYAKHLEREPSLVAATQWIAGEKLEHEQFHPQVQRALERAAKPLQRYRCAACGFEASQHFWQCPGCQAWDSYPTRRVEEL